MTDLEAVERIHQRARAGQAPGLARIRALLGELGDPQKGLRFVHIAGSNGKGSTAAMLASVFTQAGLRTGLYTSPHLHRFHERFQADGEAIAPQDLAELAGRVLEVGGDYTEFELMTAIGMLYFQKARCAIVVLETGLGGRLDPTNVIDAPEAAVITRIGLEHTRQLGDTLERIAGEKAGIIKPGSPVILCRQEAAVLEAIQRRCGRNELVLTDPEGVCLLSSSPEGQSFTYRGRGPFQLPLLGGHQLQNAAAALDTLWVLQKRGWPVPEGAVQSGLKRTRWPARLELAGREPDVLLDGGHNPQCMEALAGALRALYPGKKILFVLGVLADKDYPAMLAQLLPLAKQVVCLAPDSPRALPGEALARAVRAQGVPAQACSCAREAVARAYALAGREDVICMCGSLYLVGELRETIRRNG